MRPGRRRPAAPRRPRRRPCACEACAKGLAPPPGLEGLATLPEVDSPEVQELALRALQELRLPLKARLLNGEGS